MPDPRPMRGGKFYSVRMAKHTNIKVLTPAPAGQSEERLREYSEGSVSIEGGVLEVTAGREVQVFAPGHWIEASYTKSPPQKPRKAAFA